MTNSELSKLLEDNLSFSEAMKVIKRSKNSCDEQKAALQVRIAVISSGSIQYFTKILTSVMLARGYECEIYESDYDGINMDILNRESPLYSFHPNFVVVIPHYVDVKEYPSLIGDEQDYNLTLSNAIAYQRNIFTCLSVISGCHIFYGNYVVPFLRETGSYEVNTKRSKNSYIHELNRQMVENKPSEVTILDLDSYASYVGKAKWFDMTGYFCNKLPFALDYILPITNQIGRLIEILSGHQKKCLVLDLDNTLWGGVVGDLGTQGIVLDPNDAEGEAYRFFQSYVKSLKERGVILAVCSKNDMEVATAPFVENPNMILCRDDISCFIANWEDKASNLKRIAKELNIGLDSLVFFDDNPAEREIIHSYLPSVTVIDVPEDVDSYALALDHSGVFDWIEITNEDIGRVQTYQANAERKKLEETAVDYDQYLRSLEMVGEVSRIKEADVERFTQLINKSNQFNLRTMRYNDKQIQDMLHDESYILLGVKLKDKFSFYGIIACVILHIENTKDRAVCFIDSLVMSCRVLKRGVEIMIMNDIKSVADTCGTSTIETEYIRTNKNGMVDDLFETFGLEVVYADDNKKKYRANVTDLKTMVCYIRDGKW